MAYIYLTAAIITEVIGTLALKASDGFSKFQPSAIVVAGYATAFFFLSLTLRRLRDLGRVRDGIDRSRWRDAV
jgi:small multidrug resistance pump